MAAELLNWCFITEASYMYTGLLGPVFNFIAHITNAGKGLVKFVMCNDVPGHQVHGDVEEWHMPSVQL